MTRSLVTYFDYKSPYGRLEHDHIKDEAHALGVFGVPSFVVDGELYWGGEHLPALRERLGRGADA